MRGRLILQVTQLLALVLPTVEGPRADVSTFKTPNPFFCQHLLGFSSILCKICPPTLSLITILAAKYALLYLATITTGVNSNFASSTETFVAGSFTIMNAAWHEFTADGCARPAIIVISIHTSSGDLLLSTKASLCRAHMWTRGTRPCVTRAIVRVRAAFGFNMWS